MIRSFADKDTESLFHGERVRKFVNIEAPARRKHWTLRSLLKIHVPPGNRLEALKGDRKGQYSIRVNDQYRVCFP